MKSLYLILDVLTVLFPLVLSFDKRVAYFKQWKYVFFATIIIGIPFLVWDVYFTLKGVWGFNPDYLIGVNLVNLPVEEVLFFVFIPFSCLFIYACVKAYFSKINFLKFNSVFYFMIILYIIFIGVFGYRGLYSQSVIVSSLFTLWLIWRNVKSLTYLPIAFIISLIPFLLVNGILTGAVTPEPVVWYNDLERTPFRIFTIPSEDVLYSFTLIGLNILVFERMRKLKV